MTTVASAGRAGFANTATQAAARAVDLGGSPHAPDRRIAIIAGGVGAVFSMVVASFVAALVVLPRDGENGADAAVGGPTTVTMAGLDFVPATVEVEHGEVAVDLRNRSAITHTFTIDELGVDAVLNSGDRTSLRFAAAPGTYAITCTIPGHLTGGMQGELRVE